MPIVGVARVYPEFNKRAGKIFTLKERIAGCFLRSQNGSETMQSWKTVDSAMAAIKSTPEVSDLVAYIDWLSEGCTPPLAWRGHNVIRPENISPVESLDVHKGETLFREKCANCHGEGGQGVDIGDKKAGPLWGPMSWNDGAGAARIYTLAGIIRYAMPYLDPGSLTDEEALLLAAYISAQPRPVFPFKKEDFGGKHPPDAVYYK
jgi:thiosulfate dehydrogenase